MASRPAGRAGVVSVAVLALLLGACGAAFGYFSTIGAGTGSATAAVLGQPGGVAGAQGANTSTVAVSWSAPTNGATPSGYYVQRTSTGGGSAQPACGTSAASPTSNLSCSDTGVGAGTYTYVVNAVFATWTRTSTPSAAVTVAPIDQTVSFTSTAPASAVVGGATYSPTATATSGLAVSFTSATTSVCTSSSAVITFVAAGTCTVNADQAGNANYKPAPRVQQSFTVGKGTQTITFNGSPGATAAVGRTGAASATGGASGNAVTFTSATTSVCTVSGSTVNYVAAGTCTVNGNQAGNANYDPAGTATQTYTVAPVVQVISDLSMLNSGAAGYFYTGDTVTLSFSKKMNPTSICSTWSSTGGSQSIPVTIGLSGSAVTVTTSTCTLRYGAIDLGAAYGSGYTFNGTLAITNNGANASLTLTVGGPTVSGSLTYQGSGSVPSFTPAPGVRDDLGEQLPTSAYVAAHPSTL